MGLFGNGRGSLLIGGVLGRSLFRGSSSSGSGSVFVSSNHYDKMDVVREVIKKSDTLSGEFLRTIDDARDEFFELCTDGFVEMVVKGNKEYKTSFEIRDDADEMIGGTISRYQERCHAFNIYLDELNDKINDLQRKKLELAKNINQTLHELPNMPAISSYMSLPSYIQQESTVDKICDCLGIGTGIRRRKENANEYLEDAKDFAVEILDKIAGINRVQVFLDTIKINLAEEDILLVALKKSLAKKGKLPYNEVAVQLHILLSEYILDVNGEKNKKYIEAVEVLKKFR